MIRCLRDLREARMRGSDERTGEPFSYVDLEKRVPAKHPLRLVRVVVTHHEIEPGGWGRINGAHPTIVACPLPHLHSLHVASGSHQSSGLEPHLGDSRTCYVSIPS